MTLADIDRTIFEALRKAVVAEGFLPDITLYADGRSYQTAVEDLAQNLKFKQPIYVLGVGAENSRDDKRPNRFVIDRMPLEPGTLGSFGVVNFAENEDGTSFTKKESDSTTYDIKYEIRCISNSTYYDRIMQTILLTTFNKISYQFLVQGSIVTDEVILVRHLGAADMKAGDLLESIYTYQAEDIFITDGRTLDDNIKKINRIDVDVSPKINLDETGVNTLPSELTVRP